MTGTWFRAAMRWVGTLSIAALAVGACTSDFLQETCEPADPTLLGPPVIAVVLEGHRLDDVVELREGDIVAMSRAVPELSAPEAFEVWPQFRRNDLDQVVVIVQVQFSEPSESRYAYVVEKGGDLLHLSNPVRCDDGLLRTLNERPGSGLEALIELVEGWPDGRQQLADDISEP